MSDARHLLGVFSSGETLLGALRTLKARKIEIVEVYSPFQNEEILELLSTGKSPVRFVTFTGAAAGLVSGLGLALITSATWRMVVGGKPVFSVVPFIVVGFELTILLGALLTLAGLLLFAGLPHRRFPSPAYRPEFSDDRFGLWIACPVERAVEARDVLSQAGANEVQEIVDPSHGATEVRS
jgi:hypothetical protein